MNAISALRAYNGCRKIRETLKFVGSIDWTIRKDSRNIRANAKICRNDRCRCVIFFFSRGKAREEGEAVGASRRGGRDLCRCIYRKLPGEWGKLNYEVAWVTYVLRVAFLWFSWFEAKQQQQQPATEEVSAPLSFGHVLDHDIHHGSITITVDNPRVSVPSVTSLGA